MGELKREILGEPGSIPADRLIEYPRGHPVDLGQVRVQVDLETANRADANSTRKGIGRAPGGARLPPDNPVHAVLGGNGGDGPV